MRSAIATAQTLLAQLETAAADAIAIEKRLRELDSASKHRRDIVAPAPSTTGATTETESHDTDALDALESSRLRLQRDRKLVTCAALKRQLDAMNADALFCASQAELAALTHFAKRVHKKQVRPAALLKAIWSWHNGLAT